MDLNQVTVPSSDMERSITFYQTLGFELIVHTHERYARFALPDGDASFSLQYRPGYVAAQGIHLYFEVDDVEATYKDLQSKGITFISPPEMKSWLWNEAHLLDPDENYLIIFHAGDNRLNPPWRLRK